MNAPVAVVGLMGVQVTLDRLLYQHLPPEKSDGMPHAFIYFLTIHNNSDVAVTILGRKWVVTHDDGTQSVVEGQGVRKRRPFIPPGGRFSYNSVHTIRTNSAIAEGTFVVQDAKGRVVLVRIPPFQMQVPRTV